MGRPIKRAGHTFAYRFPLAERALERRSRSWEMFVWRAVIVGIGWVLLMVQYNPQPDGVSNGELFARFMVAFQVFALVIVVLLRTPGAIARERVNRTLDLLLLADFRGIDLLLTQFLVILVELVTFILLPVPLLAAASIFGGVSVPEAALRMVALVFTGCALTVVGLALSAAAPSPRQASIGIAAWLVLWCGGTWAVDVYASLPYLISPVTAVLEPRLEVMIPLFLQAVALTLACIPFALWQLRVRGPRVRAQHKYRPPSSPSHDEALFKRALYVAGGGAQRSNWRLAGYVLVAPLIWALAILPCLGTAAFLVVVFYNIANRLDWWRQSEEVDLLVMTRIDGATLAHVAIRQSLLRSLIFLPGFLFVGPYQFLFFLAATEEGLHPLPVLIVIHFLVLGVVNYIGAIGFSAGMANDGCGPGGNAMVILIAYGVLSILMYLCSVPVAMGLADAVSERFVDMENTWRESLIMAVVSAPYLLVNFVLFSVGLTALKNRFRLRLQNQPPVPSVL